MRKKLDYLDYIIFVLMLVFTTFEYFFRESKLSVAISILAIAIVIMNQSYKKYNLSIPIVAIIVLLTWYLIQSAFIIGRTIIQPISLCITILGAISIAIIVEDRFSKIFVTVMYCISIIAIVIYLLCLDPSIRAFLVDDLTRNFTSLNVEAAIQEGGGKNFIIHNFSSGDNLLEATGMLRNCGPFWEPGMFAVFLNIALFLHNMVERQKLPLCNLILILALISTFSAGGYICGLIVLLSYIFTRKNHLISAIGIGLFIVLSKYFMQLEYIGEKLVDQSSEIEVGSDASRFSALLTQVEMIKDSPILGGGQIQDYMQIGEKTLASGLLLPFVTYGIPIGMCYMIIMLLSLIWMLKSKNQGAFSGIMFFILILSLSFSQTILLSQWMLVVMFVGLLSRKNNSYNEC